jgi:hypothetical protein
MVFMVKNCIVSFVLISLSLFLLITPATSYAQSEFSFFVASDMHEFTGSGGYNTTSYFRGATEKMASLDSIEPASFIVTVGDQCPIDRVDTLDVTWTMETYLGADFAWYPVVGNHERPGNCAVAEAYPGENLAGIKAIYHPGNGPAQCEDSTISFDYMNSHFILIN